MINAAPSGDSGGRFRFWCENTGYPHFVVDPPAADAGFGPFLPFLLRTRPITASFLRNLAAGRRICEAHLFLNLNVALIEGQFSSLQPDWFASAEF